jgi:hypothetical protein
VARIQRAFNVQVHYCYDPATYFPPDWSREPASASGSQIDDAEAARTVELIDAFLSKYPLRLIQNSLRHVYLLGRLSVYGRNFGGTYYADRIYLVNEGLGAGYSSGFLLAALHHEFSSILYGNYGFPKEQWNNVNGEGWQYTGYGRAFDVLERVNLFEHTERLHRQGFLMMYSQASLEEDFNTYAEYLFTEPLWLISAATKHQKIWLKLRIVVAFYRKLGVEFQATDGLNDTPCIEPKGKPRGCDGRDSPTPPFERLGELPSEVFGPLREHSVTFTIPDSRTYRLTGPATVTVTGPATVTVTGPGSGPVTIAAQPR